MCSKSHRTVCVFEGTQEKNMTTKETKPDYRDEMRKAVEESKCAAHRDDIAALIDLIGQQAKDCTCSASLADRRRVLIELAARPMFTANCSEAEVYEAIEDNLELLREAAAKKGQ